MRKAMRLPVRHHFDDYSNDATDRAGLTGSAGPFKRVFQ